jgi:hypothetical protein
VQRRNSSSQVINLAIPGLVTYQNLRPDGYVPPTGRPEPISGNNITAALALQPDAIIINMPSNDAANLYTLEEQQNNFESAISLAEAAGIPVWITTTQPRNFIDPNQTALLFSLKDWLISRFGNKVVDFWNGIANEDGSIKTNFNFDNIHLNDSGHQILYERIAAANLLDSLCSSIDTLIVTATNPSNIILPTNSVITTANAFSPNGIVSSYSWRRLSGPVNYNIPDTSLSTIIIENLVEGNYAFEVTVTDNLGNIAKDTINFIVSTRILFDFGSTATNSPDINSNYWNNIASARNGVLLQNAITNTNQTTTVGLEVINRIDGTFNIAGPGTNSGNTTGDVVDYPNTATTDYAFAHPSATTGQWRLFGLDSLRNYTIKFWGSRSVTDARVIEIKTTDSINWQSYDAMGNTDYNNAAVFNIKGKNEVTFDIRVQAGSPFGYIGLIDIQRTLRTDLPNLPPTANAGNDTMIISPANIVHLDGSASLDIDGNIVAYEWRKISGPQLFNISNSNNVATTVTNLREGNYKFELIVTDNNGSVGRDTISVLVGSRVLIDFGPAITLSPDLNGNYWNNINTTAAGIILNNAVTTNNLTTSIGISVVNRIDGTFNISGPGTNTGNTAGDVNDYPNSATTDYAFAHPSATNGQWKMIGLDSNKTYMVKFWGTRTVTDPRVIEIKLQEDAVWQSYNAASNSNYQNAATFSFTGKTEAIFDIRVQSGSPFGYISVLDIIYTNNPSTGNIAPVARAGADQQLTLPTNTATLDGSLSSDLDGGIVTYEWTKIAGPADGNIVTPDASICILQNLAIGQYQFQLKVTDDQGATGIDTIIINVAERIVFDFGNTITSSPDANNIFWNNITTANEGVKVVDAVKVDNSNSGISMEVVSRIDGTFNPAGPGVNSANTIGNVADYPNSATIDYAFAHPSATNGQWKFSGLDSTKEYQIKFWGTRNATDPRIIEIKPSFDTTWKSYDGANNTNYNNAAVFSISRKTAVVFDIRVKSPSPFGYICVVDINITKPNCLPNSSTTNITTCDSFSWNGNTYNESGTYIFNTTNANGCDSIATLNLILNNATSSTTNITTCDSFSWNGNTYNESGTYIFNTTNANGCDSIATLNLILNNTTSSTTNITACDSFSWNGNTYNESGTYIFNTTNANGCDSIATLNLIIGAASTATIAVKTCSSYTWFGTNYTITGTYTQTISNASGCDSIINLALTILPLPFTAGPIIGPTNACNFSGINGQNATYTINALNADSIVWEIPEDAVLVSGDGSSSIQVLYASTFTSGTITATCFSPCGAPIVRSLTVTKRIPSTPLAISGPTNICNFVGTGQPVTYSIAPIANALKYRWALPTSVVIVSANSDSSTINIIINSNFASVVNKILRVQSVGICGVSSFSTLALSATLPFIPARIFGPTNACIYSTPENPATYFVNKVSNATSYNWQLPVGAIVIDHPAGTGINDTVITVYFNSNFVSGSLISVNSVAACGSSSSRSIAISNTSPNAPTQINGVTSICVPTGQTITYEYYINKITQANGYNWTAPANSTLEHLNGLGENDTLVSITYNTSFTSGNISVSAFNGCATSTAESLTVSKLSLSTPLIQGPTNSCLYFDSAARYIIRKIPGATSYNWIAPRDVVSFVHLNPAGVDDTIVEVIFASSFARGTISVSAVAPCTTSAVRTLAISKKAVGVITSLTATVLNSNCPSRQIRYSIPAFPPNATGVNWAVPPGAIIDSGQGTTNLYVTYFLYAVTNQYVTVAGYNGCGNGATKKILVNLPECPLPPFAGDGAQNKKMTAGATNSHITLKVTPNPSSNQFGLHIESKEITPCSMNIINAMGEIVERKILNHTTEVIFFGSNYRPGLYFVEVIQQKQKAVIKVIKQ